MRAAQRDARGGVRRNLISNPSFEMSVDGWSEYQAGQATRSTEHTHVGAAVLKITAFARAGTYSGTRFTLPNLPPDTYTMSAWLYLPAAYAAGVQARVIASHGQTFDPVGSTIGAWQRIKHTFTTTAVTPTAQLYFCTSNSKPAEGQVFYLDGAMLESSRHPLPYADGDTLGWHWTGTPHASPSVGPRRPDTP